MLQLQDIMTTEVVTVSPDLSLQDTLELLSTRHLSGAPVVAGDDVVGVISSTDLMNFAVASPGVPRERQDDVLWNETEESDLPDGQEENDPPAAFFAELWAATDTDVGEQFRDSTGLERNVLEESTVAEAMTRAVRALPPDTPIAQAAEFMRTSDIHRVLVMQGRRLLGIVTTTDIMNAVADHRLTAHRDAFGSRVDRGDR